MTWLDDPEAKKLLKEISIIINSKNPERIKKELQSWLRNKDSGINEKEYLKAIEELERNGVPK